jgi:hypothetical protein
VRRTGALIPLFAAWALVGSPSCGDRVAEVITPKAPACSGGARCPAVKPVCDATTMSCRGCATDLECPSPGLSHCHGATAQCVSCLQNADCSGPFRTICDTSAHRCVECLVDTHCPFSDETCNLVAGSCTIPCSADAECFIAFPFCDPGVRLCVECRTDAECADLGLPRCRALTCTF